MVMDFSKTLMTIDRNLMWKKYKEMIDCSAKPVNLNRSCHAQMMIENNTKIFVSGGETIDSNPNNHKPISESFIVDIEKAEIQRTADMRVARSQHSMIRVNDKIYCVGGSNKTTSTEIYDIK